jgi:hypothetical protein
MAPPDKTARRLPCDPRVNGIGVEAIRDKFSPSRQAQRIIGSSNQNKTSREF